MSFSTSEAMGLTHHFYQRVRSVLPVMERGPNGPRDSGRTVFFPVGADRPARRRPATLDLPILSRPFPGPTRMDA